MTSKTGMVMPQTVENIKPAMSNPAKILLAYMRLSNVWDSRALAAEFGVPLRTIQRWKMECAASATDATGAISGVPSEHEHSATRATSATDGAPQAPDLALARDLQRAQATKASLRDTSSNIHFHPSFRPDARECEREPEAPADGRPAAFNDATESMIADVLEFMGPTASRQNAEKWLSGTLSVYGTDRTTRAWTALVAKRARNEPVSQPLALWAKTAGGLKPQAVAPKGADPTTFHLVSPSTVRFAKPREEVGHA